MKPTLLIMAAGMGSRYGGLKQLDGVGPSGETIMDYSVYDAVRSGFGKIVFIIARHFENEFREKVLSKYENIIPTEVVFQSVDALPEGFSAPAGRTKPWGTGHAVLMAKEAVTTPFAVINADDFYGRDAFETISKFLSSPTTSGHYCMVGYRVGNTLSESGTVSRGVCTTDSAGRLLSITERTEIRRLDGRGIIFKDENDEFQTIEDDAPVSMNMWGFTQDYFELSERLFRDFLTARGTEEKSEFYIPYVVNEAITSRIATVDVLNTSATWFGVTYASDKPQTMNRIRELIAAGEYPEQLWK